MSEQSPSYRSRTVQGRRWVWHRDRIIGVLTSHPVRTHVYPLFTPDGVLVLQEAPADHFHQQGLMVGQDKINGENFWAMLCPGYPLNRQELIEEDCEITERGVTFRCTLDWTTAENRKIIREQRTVRLAHHGDCNEAFVRSTFVAQFGAVEFGQTKEGGIGMRVNALLETELGGRILDAEGCEGEPNIFDQKAAWIDVSGPIMDSAAGILMAPDAREERIGWFTRGYGIHLHSPRRHSPLQLSEGQSTSSAVRFLAHDGILDVPQLNAMLQRVTQGGDDE